MSETPRAHATLDPEAAGIWRVNGALNFATVSALLPAGGGVIAAGHPAVIDLQGVTASDSSGLALLIEWLSEARAAGCDLRYENIPAQLQQIIRLSEVEALFGLGAAASGTGGDMVHSNMAGAPLKA